MKQPANILRRYEFISQNLKNQKNPARPIARLNHRCHPRIPTSLFVSKIYV
ncbi:unnamed protein product [Nesidiocoris tenuis]|uniref:Uncharacterized protein n=1 Tax=Nesidiocoris tenuis TaxID=355587 RepID=A0A6H5G798_9HEMI|nr:unnamed protein product [Nesidiocoris tenuis]